MGERGKIWAYSVEFCTKTGGIGFGPKAVVFQPLLESLTMPSSGSFQSLWKAGHCDVGSLPWGRRPGPRLCLHLVQSRCQSPDQDLEGSWGPAPSQLASTTCLTCPPQGPPAAASMPPTCSLCRASPLAVSPVLNTYPRNPCRQLPRSHPELCQTAIFSAGPSFTFPIIRTPCPSDLVLFFFMSLINICYHTYTQLFKINFIFLEQL